MNVSEEETDQVTTIEEHRLDLEDADVFYFKFVDEEVASTWYDALLKLPTCESIVPSCTYVDSLSLFQGIIRS